MREFCPRLMRATSAFTFVRAMALCPCALRLHLDVSFPWSHSAANSGHGRTPMHLQVRSYYSRDSPSPVTQKGKYSRGLKRDNIVQPKPRVLRDGETLVKYYATCAPGLEEVLAAELASPLVDAQEVEVGSAGVSFVGSQATGYKANLWLRTAVRVLVQLAAGPLPSGRGQYDPVYIFIRDAVDWASILVDDSSQPVHSNGRQSESIRRGTLERREDRTGSPRFRSFAVQSRVWNCTEISNSNFASVRAKDAICDAVRDACGGHRPEPPVQGADVPLFLSLYRDSAVLYRDLSGVSLHKRGYRDVMHKASLNEGIAAAVLTLAGWNQAVPGFGAANKHALEPEHKVLLDPMCGSGTFLIEAALMACNTAPGLLRRQWPFQTWHDFDQRSWRQCTEAALSAQLSSSPAVRLLGNDIHEGALSLCKRDAKTAGVLHLLDLSCEDCQDYQPPIVPSLVVTNPPWGERLADSSSNEEEWLYATWQGLGRFVKAKCSCADVYVLSGNAEVTRAMHMRADRKWPLTIGGQERKLLHYHVLPRKLSSTTPA